MGYHLGVTILVNIILLGHVSSGSLDFNEYQLRPGHPEYYLSVDPATSNVLSTDELKRTHRSLWKKFLKDTGLEDLFGNCNRYNNYYNGPQPVPGGDYNMAPPLPDYLPPFQPLQPFGNFQPFQPWKLFEGFGNRGNTVNPPAYNGNGVATDYGNNNGINFGYKPTYNPRPDYYGGSGRPNSYSPPPQIAPGYDAPNNYDSPKPQEAPPSNEPSYDQPKENNYNNQKEEPKYDKPAPASTAPSEEVPEKTSYEPSTPSDYNNSNSKSDSAPSKADSYSDNDQYAGATGPNKAQTKPNSEDYSSKNPQILYQPIIYVSPQYQPGVGANYAMTPYDLKNPTKSEEKESGSYENPEKDGEAPAPNYLSSGEAVPSGQYAEPKPEVPAAPAPAPITVPAPIQSPVSYNSLPYEGSPQVSKIAPILSPGITTVSTVYTILTPQSEAYSNHLPVYNQSPSLPYAAQAPSPPTYGIPSYPTPEPQPYVTISAPYKVPASPSYGTTSYNQGPHIAKPYSSAPSPYAVPASPSYGATSYQRPQIAKPYSSAPSPYAASPKPYAAPRPTSCSRTTYPAPSYGPSPIVNSSPEPYAQPIRLTYADQPYRECPELFTEYNMRLNHMWN